MSGHRQQRRRQRPCGQRRGPDQASGAEAVGVEDHADRIPSRDVRAERPARAQPSWHGDVPSQRKCNRHVQRPAGPLWTRDQRPLPAPGPLSPQDNAVHDMERRLGQFPRHGQTRNQPFDVHRAHRRPQAGSRRLPRRGSPTRRGRQHRQAVARALLDPHLKRRSPRRRDRDGDAPRLTTSTPVRSYREPPTRCAGAQTMINVGVHNTTAFGLWVSQRTPWVHVARRVPRDDGSEGWPIGIRSKGPSLGSWRRSAARAGKERKCAREGGSCGVCGNGDPRRVWNELCGARIRKQVHNAHSLVAGFCVCRRGARGGWAHTAQRDRAIPGFLPWCSVRCPGSVPTSRRGGLPPRAAGATR